MAVPLLPSSPTEVQVRVAVVWVVEVNARLVTPEGGVVSGGVPSGVKTIVTGSASLLEMAKSSGLTT